MMHELIIRLRHLLLGWGAVGLVYSLCGMWQGAGVVVPETLVDQLIPFSTSGIWLYLSFFLIVPCAYFMTHENQLLWLERSMQLSAIISGVIFLVWPTTLHYPALTESSRSADVYLLLSANDSAQNCLPSLHGALTVLCVWAMWNSRRPYLLVRSILMAVWGLGILYATIQTRRHLSMDLTAGVVVGVISGLITRHWLSRRHHNITSV